MKRRKIAEVVAVYPPYGGGLGMVTREQTRMLSSEYDVTVYTPRYPGRSKPQADASVKHLIPALAFGNAAWVPALFFHLRTCDIIHLHYPFIGASLACLAARAVWRKKLVVTYHMDLVGRSQPFRALFTMYQRLITPLVLHFADQITVTSHSYAHASTAAHLFKRYVSKVIEIPNSVDTNLFCPGEPTAARKQSLTPNDEPMILFVGGLDRPHYFKGVEVLLEAFHRVRLESNAVLVLIGDGDCRLGFQEHARSLGLTSAVHFVGSIPSSSDLVDYYRLSDVVVLPSTDASEAFGVVLIEAGACAKPVITTNLPGPSSVVDDGVTGCTVPIKDSEKLKEALFSILNNQKRAQQMGDAGLKRVRTRYSNRSVGESLRAGMRVI